MKIIPGVRVNLTMNGLAGGEVEVLLTVAAQIGSASREQLVARNVCQDTPTAIRCAVDFLEGQITRPAPADEDPF